MSVLDVTLFGNTLTDWGISLLLFVLTFLLLQVIRRFILRRVTRLAERTKTDIDDLIADLLGNTKLFFLFILALYVASLGLTLPENVQSGIRILTGMASLLQVGFWGTGVLTYVVTRQVEARLKEDTGGATAINALGIIAKTILWAVVGLLALDNIPGVEVDSLIASLGIGGIAVALAVQNILGDLFAALMIALDQPFAIGHFIIAGDKSGTVEHIGLKSTRLRAPTGELLVLSNSELLKNPIRNFKHLQQRRSLFTFGVSYDTPAEKLEAIPELVKEIVEKYPVATFNRAHLKELGDFSIIYEVLYHVNVPDYQTFIEVQQAINLDILKRFAEEGIEMPYPTQAVILEK
jgi:small-conductance mechanosensitive channel